MLAKCVLGAVAFSAVGVATWNWAIQPETEQVRRAVLPSDTDTAAKPPIGDFLSRVGANDERPEYCAVRVQLPSADGSLVPVWVDVLSAEGEVLVGVVSNCEEPLCGRKLGDPIRVRASQIDDWMVIEGGKLQGAMSLTAN
ncbi:MAG: DUF2314 domain-containing protein [Fimbriimonadaceae bacterium]